MNEEIEKLVNAWYCAWLKNVKNNFSQTTNKTGHFFKDNFETKLQNLLPERQFTFNKIQNRNFGIWILIK